MPLIVRALLLALGLMLCARAEAACTVSAASSTQFGSQTSYAVRAGTVPQVQTQPPAGLSCSGAMITLLSTGTVTATTTSTNNFMLQSGGAQIPYRLYADPNGSILFTQGGSQNYFSSTLLNLLGILGDNNFVPTLYARIAGTPNVPAGTYTDTVTIAWAWDICQSSLICILPITRTQGSGTTTMTVSLTVTSDCRISAPDISFGNAPLASQFAAVNQAVLTDCTLGTPYDVAFDDGQNRLAGSWRRMRSGSDFLEYNIYRPDGTTIWDLANPLPAGPGTGETTPGRIQNYVARINSAQQTPPAGLYADTVSVVITF